VGFGACLVAASWLYPHLKGVLPGFVPLAARGTARLAGGLLSLRYDDVEVVRSDLLVDGFGVSVIEECTGIFEILIFACAVLPVRTAPWRRLAGVAAGGAVLYAVNALRVAVVTAAGGHSYHRFEFLHLYLWQATLVGLVAAIWLAWWYTIGSADAPGDRRR